MRKTETAIGVVRATPDAEINLLAGQLYFGRDASKVRTLLGSCVAITLWHPQKRLGGMCHFLLPSRRREDNMPLDGRFGEEALALLASGISQAGTQTQDYEVHLYGGADTMPDHLGVKLNVGERNIEKGCTLIEAYGFQLLAVDVGDEVPRNVVMNMRDGSVDMRRGTPRGAPLRREAA